MKSSKLLRWLIPVLIGLVTFGMLLATNPDIGLTWDEPAYIAAQESYANWFEELFTHPQTALNEQTLTKAWQVNSEHPPVDKVWSALVWSVARNFSDDLTAHRMGNMLLVSIMAALLYYWMKESFGYVAGFTAVAALFTMPRFFFHAHLSALDVPATFAVFITTFVFWQIKDKSKWTWGILLGVVWGIALATKINAIFLPFTLGLWWLIFNRKSKLFWRLVFMGLFAIPVFFVSWPWLYQHTIQRLVTYIGFVTVNHWQIGQYYLGQFFMPPPWHFGFVILWAVLPLSLILLFLIGVIQNRSGKRDNGLGWLFFISALTPVVVIAVSRSIVYDDERMYMAAFPFIAGLAGIGLSWLAIGLKKLSTRWNKAVLYPVGLTLLVLLAFAPQLITMIKLYPHYLSYYGEGVGGLKGATKMGLETTYWCETYAMTLDIINAQAEPGDKIWTDPYSYDVLIYYQTQGKLRDDLVVTNPQAAATVLGDKVPNPRVVALVQNDWFIFHHHQTMLGWDGNNSNYLKILAKQTKVFEYSFDGVPIMTLYKK